MRCKPKGAGDRPLSLPHLKQGLNGASAASTARIIIELTGMDAVAITDRHKVLAYEGVSSDHHQPVPSRPGLRPGAGAGDVEVAQSKASIGCREENCLLQSGVVVPLLCQNRVIGSLNFTGPGRRYTPGILKCLGFIPTLFHPTGIGRSLPGGVGRQGGVDGPPGPDQSPLFI